MKVQLGRLLTGSNFFSSALLLHQKNKITGNEASAKQVRSVEKWRYFFVGRKELKGYSTTILLE